jgi:3D (Asp-Asp-Asp) domain-containing protein
VIENMKRPLITLAILWGLFTLHLHYDARRAHEAFVELAVQLQDTVTALHQAQDEILWLESMAEDFTTLDIQRVVATGYAPLDPEAKNGMCYQGNPNVTASGEPTQPLITIAAGPDLPFGTWVWLEGFGWRRVDDRGSRIKPGHVDICFPTRAEALEWGRREILMVVPGWNNEQK